MCVFRYGDTGSTTEGIGLNPELLTYVMQWVYATARWYTWLTSATSEVIELALLLEHAFRTTEFVFWRQERVGIAQNNDTATLVQSDDRLTCRIEIDLGGGDPRPQKPVPLDPATPSQRAWRSFDLAEHRFMSNT